MTRKPLIAISLKTYFTHAQTLRWCDQVSRLNAELLRRVDVIVLPMATTLASVVSPLTRKRMRVGAQDCSWTQPGAFTGELPARALFDAGARVVELGHAERRRHFAETDEVVAAKARAATAAGLTPLICVGESERVSAEEAAEVSLGQLRAATKGISPASELIVAYEPVWAIGAEVPAPAEHVRPVCRTIGQWLSESGPTSRVIYGGTAGPGVFTEMRPDVDGLFLGRRAHNIDALIAVLHEAAQAAPLVSVERTQGDGHD